MEIIRKVVIGGDPKNGMAFVVGNSVRDSYEISSIVRDEVSHNTFHIYVVDKYEDVTKKWKEVSGNYMVELDLDF